MGRIEIYERIAIAALIIAPGISIINYQSKPSSFDQLSNTESNKKVLPNLELVGLVPEPEEFKPPTELVTKIKHN